MDRKVPVPGSSGVWKLIHEFEEDQVRRGFKANTIYLKTNSLEKFFVYLEEKHPGKTYGNITAEDIRKYLDDFENLTGKSLSPYMYNRRIYYFTEFYNFLLEKEEVLLSPAIQLEYLPVTKGEHLGVFTEDEVKAILEAIEDSPIGRRDRAMIELLYGSGLRRSELVNLDVEDIYFDEREIFIKHGKNDKERIVPAGEEALKALERYMEERHRWMRPGGERKALFLSAEGNRIQGACVQNIIKKRKEKAGIAGKGSAHAFRHSMASHLLSNGAPIQAIQRILGHEHLNTTEKYVRLLEKDMRQVHKESHPKAGKEE